MIKINPQDLKQTNRSDKLGSLWSTFNIDLDSNKGALRVSPRMKLNTGSLNSVPVAIKRYEDRIFMIAGTTIYRNTDNSGLPNDPFEADDTLNFTTDYSSDTGDLETAFLYLWATAQTQLRRLGGATGGIWVDVATMLTGYNHKLCYFQKFDRLYFMNGGISSVSSTLVVATTGNYTLANIDERWTDMKASRNYIWLGVTPAPDTLQGAFLNQGLVRRWDGISTDVDEYKLPCGAAVAIVVNNTSDAPMVIGSDGISYQFNGSGFVEVGRFPYTNYLPINAVSTSNNRFIHPNGIVETEEGDILAFINGLNSDNGATQNENLPSGIWRFDKERGWTHVDALSYDPISTSITDYGQNRISRVGALMLMNVYSTTSGRDGTMMAGATYFTDATTPASAVFFDNSIDTIQKYGYIVTTKIFSDKVEEVWQNLYTRHKKLLDSADSIVVKYRQDETAPVEATITWTSTTTFTTTTDISAYTNYEVEVIQGKGSGKTAKITTIVNNGGTYTVTVSTDFTGVGTSGTAKARFQKWIEIGTETSQVKSFLETMISKQSTWIQLKVCMLFKGKDEIDDFILTSKTQKEAI